MVEKRSIPTHGGISRDATYVINLLAQEVSKKNPTITIHEKASPRIPRKLISIIGLLFGGVGVKLQENELYFEALFSGFKVTKSSNWHVVRVHDVFPLSNPEWFNKRSVLTFKKSINRTIQRKNVVFLCNSKTTEKKFIRLFPQVEGSTFVIYCNPQRPSIRNSTNCSCTGCLYTFSEKFKPFILAVGTIEPRKNYESILEISKNKEVKVEIVIAGKPGWKTKRTQRLLRDSQKIVWLSDCCDLALDSLYRNCHAFLSASFDEGFNLPAGEARLYGKSLILPKLPIYDELYGNRYKSFKDDFELLEHINGEDIQNLPYDNVQIDYNAKNKESMQVLIEIIGTQKSL